jgi:hypothetical protein
MDLLLRLLERRVIFGLAAVFAALLLSSRFGDYWYDRADMMAHPPAAVSSPLAADMVKDNETVAAAKVRGLHRAVSAEIAKAAAEGFQVDALQKSADDILKMDGPEYRSVAIERLNRLRMAIPQKKTITRTAGSDDRNDSLEAPAPKRARKRR